MTQILLILTFLMVTTPEVFGAPDAAEHPLRAVGVSLALFAALGVLGHLVIARCAVAVDRTGSYAALRRAEFGSRSMRIGAVVVHGFNIISLGWVPAIHSLTGGLPFIDQLLAITPVMVLWSWSWWAFEPLDRRTREATMVRQLDQGLPLYPIPSRGRFVLMSMRHQVLYLALPMIVILGWGALVSVVAAQVGGTAAGATVDGIAIVDAWAGVVQTLGVIATFVVMPWALKWIWDTTPIGPGELRSALLALCQRCGVRVRDVLVWRTDGLLINGAAIGIFYPLRYILLTDALLDRLTMPQIEAVMAHEIAHVRRHHMFWLVMVMIATAAFSGVLADIVLQSLAAHDLPIIFGFRLNDLSDNGGATLSSPVSLGVLALGLVMLGVASRRFEWQADAFAAAAMSGIGSGSVTVEGVRAMSSALGTVAALNGIPPERGSWRHGSIATRQRRLLSIIGLPVNSTPIDRQVGAIKLAAVMGIVASGILTWTLSVSGHP